MTHNCDQYVAGDIRMIAVISRHITYFSVVIFMTKLISLLLTGTVSRLQGSISPISFGYHQTSLKTRQSAIEPSCLVHCGGVGRIIKEAFSPSDLNFDSTMT